MRCDNFCSHTSALFGNDAFKMKIARVVPIFKKGQKDSGSTTDQIYTFFGLLFFLS